MKAIFILSLVLLSNRVLPSAHDSLRILSPSRSENLIARSTVQFHRVADSVTRLPSMCKDDSLFFAYTAHEFCRLGVSSFGSYRGFYDTAMMYSHPQIVRLFYSPDSLKSIAWVVFRIEHDSSCLFPESFNGLGLVAFRAGTHQLWSVYPLLNTQQICCRTIDQAIEGLANYYLVAMRHTEGFTYDDSGQPSGAEIGYNLQDPEFWDRSLIWKRDAFVHNLYDFQIEWGVTPFDISIQYPDSIRKNYSQ